MKESKTSTIRLIAIGAALPAMALIATLIASLIWHPRLPDPAAIHWGVTGTVNGFGSPWTFAVMTLVCGLLWAAIAVPSLAQSLRGSYTPSRRWMLIVALWTALFMSGVSVAGQITQLGLTSATEAKPIMLPLLWALLGSTLMCVLAFFALPKPKPEPRGAVGVVTPMPLGRNQRAAWSSTATTTPWIMVPVSAVAAASLVFGLYSAIAKNSDAWTFLPLTVVLVVVLALVGAFRVSVGSAGLVVRSYVGWPSRRIPLNDIASVELIDVVPLGDWGGYGWRTRPGGSAVVTRKGIALQVVMNSGKTFAVTAENSAEGASLLASLVARSRASASANTDANASTNTNASD